MSNSLERFQNLLRQLFQFDCADLDFGIYRILNYKRQQVEDFITTRLPAIVNEAFAEYAAADRAAVEEELNALQQQIRQTLGEEAIDEHGQLRMFHETPLGKQYLETQAKAQSVQVAEDLKTRVYNDLYTFFSRYYEDGDFVSKRRYGRNASYVIPYNGEEVVLYWANRDQYYIKTGEHFKNYSFKVDDCTVAFKLRNATTEQNGNRANKRYFVLAADNPIEWQPDAKTLTIFFEYRPLTEQEEIAYGRTEQQKPQDRLNEAAAQAILAQLEDPTLKAGLAKVEVRNGKENTVLGWRLNHFTRRNTTDFFIHKNLKGFLLRELDFFLKNEVLLLDELIAGSEADLQRHVQRARVVRRVAEAIIEFLAQVEDFQKRLFEKKKFVLSTDYVISLRTLRDLIGMNEYISIERDTVKRILEDNKYKSEIITVIRETFKQPGNNVYVREVKFDEDNIKITYMKRFVNKATFDRYREKHKVVWFKKQKDIIRGKLQDCWFVDYQSTKLPSKIEYSNLYIDTAYFHDDFKAYLLDKISQRCDLDASIDGVLIKSENWQGLNLLSEKYRGKVKCVYIDPPYNTGSDEFLYKDNYRHSSWLSLMFDRLHLSKAFLSDDGSFYVSIDWNESHSLKKLLDLTFGEDNFQREIIWNTGENISGFKSLAPNWIRQHDTIYFYSKCADRLAFNKLWEPINPEAAFRWMDIIGVDKDNLYTEIWEGGVLKQKKLERVKVKPLGDVWNDILSFQYSEPRVTESWFFDTQKVEDLLRRIIQSSTQPKDLVLDFFLGSGTTISAAHKLGRRWIGIEIADYFEDIVMPRIKSVILGETRTHLSRKINWQGGGFFKYHYLEQYEDTLNNLELPRKKEGQLALEMFGDEYLLRYMLEFETEGSPCLLNLDMFKDPFSYRLKVHEGDEIVERTVDLVETFNYLLGIDVKKMRVFTDGERPYRAVLGEKGGKRIAIVWRPVNGLEDDEGALLKDKAFIEQNVLPTLLPDGTPDRLLVNGPCFVESAETIEPEFKRLMFAEMAQW